MEIKSILKYVFLALILFFGYKCFRSRGHTIDENTSKEELMTWTQEACLNNDFATAHKYVKELSNRAALKGDWWGDMNAFYCASDALFTAESQFLIAHIDEKDAVDKIVYLITSQPTFGRYIAPGGTPDPSYEDARHYARYVATNNQRCDKLLALAIGIDNEYLARRIIPLYKDDYSYDDCIVVNSRSINEAKKRFKEAFGHSYSKL